MWIDEVTHGASEREIAALTGRSPSTVHRWKRGQRIPASDIFVIAVRYGADVVAAQRAYGWMDAARLSAEIADESIRALPAITLIEHALRKMRESEAPPPEFKQIKIGH